MAQPDAITIAAKPDTLRHLFRIIAGHPNHILEVFPNYCFISMRELEELNRAVVAKLSHYELLGSEFSAILTLRDTRFEEFNSWQAFSGRNWNTPDQTTCLQLKWQFLVRFPNTTEPASHAITVRLANQPRPYEMMQAIFSKDPEDMERFELDAAPMTCRVDFADQLLSQELLAIVASWRKALREPVPVVPFFRRLLKKASLVVQVTQNSVLLMSTLAACAAFFRWSRPATPEVALTAGAFRDNLLLLAALGIFLYLSRGLGRWLGSRAHEYLHRLERFSLFELTAGDSNRQTALSAKSRNAGLKFIASSALALLWNVVGGVLTALFLR